MKNTKIFTFVTKPLQNNISNKKFIMKESQRIAKEFDCIIFISNRTVELARECKPEEEIATELEQRVIQKKLSDSRIKKVWIYRMST